MRLVTCFRKPMALQTFKTRRIEYVPFHPGFDQFARQGILSFQLPLNYLSKHTFTDFINPPNELKRTEKQRLTTHR